jgi:MFS family permease
MTLTLASLTVRLLAGKASDRWGRKPVLRISTFAIVAAMLIISFATTKMMLFAAIILYGLAQGTTSPTLLAWTTDLSHQEFRGRGIASLYIFMEMGIGVGAFLSGWIFHNQSANFAQAFWVCSGLSLLAFTLLITRLNKFSFAS